MKFKDINLVPDLMYLKNFELNIVLHPCLHPHHIISPPIVLTHLFIKYDIWP